jgi:streptomycin 6-kinase
VAFREDNDIADIAWRAIARVGTPVSTHVIELRELPRHEGLLARARRRRSADHVLHALRARELASARNNREELSLGAVG